MELLENKVAAVFAANGAIAQAISHALAQNGATSAPNWPEFLTLSKRSEKSY
jgi:hypothetical protein